MSISLEDTKNMADLARLELSEKELTIYTENFEQVLSRVQELKNVDTKNIEPTVTPLDGQTPFRPDTAQVFSHLDILLGDAPDISDTSYVVPRIL